MEDDTEINDFDLLYDEIQEKDGGITTLILLDRDEHYPQPNERAESAGIISFFTPNISQKKIKLKTNNDVN